MGLIITRYRLRLLITSFARCCYFEARGGGSSLEATSATGVSLVVDVCAALRTKRCTRPSRSSSASPSSWSTAACPTDKRCWRCYLSLLWRHRMCFVHFLLRLDAELCFMFGVENMFAPPRWEVAPPPAFACRHWLKWCIVLPWCFHHCRRTPIPPPKYVGERVCDLPTIGYAGGAIPRRIWHFGFWESAEYAYYILSTQENRSINQPWYLAMMFCQISF